MLLRSMLQYAARYMLQCRTKHSTFTKTQGASGDSGPGFSTNCSQRQTSSKPLSFLVASMLQQHLDVIRIPNVLMSSLLAVKEDEDYEPSTGINWSVAALSPGLKVCHAYRNLHGAGNSSCMMRMAQKSCPLAAMRKQAQGCQT
eukprot:883430-Pelagomonas_calceolata.AAC.5